MQIERVAFIETADATEGFAADQNYEEVFEARS